MFDLIQKLVNAYGASGREDRVADVIEGLIRDDVDEIQQRMRWAI